MWLLSNVPTGRRAIIESTSVPLPMPQTFAHPGSR